MLLTNMYIKSRGLHPLLAHCGPCDVGGLVEYPRFRSVILTSIWVQRFWRFELLLVKAVWQEPSDYKEEQRQGYNRGTKCSFTIFS